MAIRTERSVVYHIPKCGGIWVKEAIRKSGLKYGRCRNVRVAQPFGLKREHATPGVVAEADGVGRFSFCFVRRPLSWYQSFWCYRVKTKYLDRKFPLDRIWDDDYERFLLNVLASYPDGFVTQLYRFYTEAVDFVGQQERLADDLVRALSLAGEKFDEAALRATRWRNISGGNKKFARQCITSQEVEKRIMIAERWIMDTFYDGGLPCPARSR